MQNRKQRESEIEFIKEYNSFHFTDTVHNVQTYIFNSQSTTTIHETRHKKEIQTNKILFPWYLLLLSE